MGQRGYLGTRGQPDREVLAETGAQGKGEGRGHLATPGIHGVRSGIDRHGRTFDCLRSRDREGRALARPRLPERYELPFEVLEKWRDAGEGDIPDRRGDEPPLLRPGIRFTSRQGQVVDRREFTLPRGLVLIRSEADLDCSAFDAAALAHDFFSAEQGHAHRRGPSAGREPLHRRDDPPDETQLDLSLHENGVFRIGSVVGRRGGLLAPRPGKEDLILGGAIGLQTAHGPALGGDADAARLQGETPLPFGEIAETAFHGQFMDARRRQQHPEMAIAAQDRGLLPVAKGRTPGNEGGEGHRHRRGASVGGVVGKREREGLAFELQIGGGQVGGAGEGVGCLREPGFQLVEQFLIRKLCLRVRGQREKKNP